ncbi:MAG: hypothetical protein ACTSRZ_18685, partial [Promethearchaeota archaeon]
LHINRHRQFIACYDKNDFFTKINDNKIIFGTHLVKFFFDRPQCLTLSKFFNFSCHSLPPY